MKNKINVGDIINGWKILSRIESDKKYSYNYECQCIECGNTRQYNKYYITKGFECPKCKVVINIYDKYDEFIETLDDKHNIPSVEEIDIDRAYKHRCENGHKFISSLSKYNGCIKCKSYDIINKNIDNLINSKIELEQHIHDKLDDIMEFDIEENVIVPIMDKEYVYNPRFVSNKHKIYINIISELDKKFDKTYHTSRSEFVRSIVIKRASIDYYKSKGYLIWDVLSTGDLTKDVEIFDNTSSEVISILAG